MQICTTLIRNKDTSTPGYGKEAAIAILLVNVSRKEEDVVEACDEICCYCCPIVVGRRSLTRREQISQILFIALNTLKYLIEI